MILERYVLSVPVWLGYSGVGGVWDMICTGSLSYPVLRFWGEGGVVACVIVVLCGEE